MPGGTTVMWERRWVGARGQGYVDGWDEFGGYEEELPRAAAR